MTGINGARGEAAVTIGGVAHRLCLTLGALAEIETALGLAAPEELAARMARLSARDVAAVLAALLAGGGVETETARMLAAEAAPADAAQAIADAFATAAQE